MATATTQSKSAGPLASLLVQSTDKLLTCVHCGLCLPACPTYRVLGDENDSPRGRVYLMRGLVEGKLPLGESFASHIDLCLGCRACESVCPSGVPYGQLLEAARAEVAQAQTQTRSIPALLVRFVLNNVFTRPRVLRAVFALTRWFRDSGLPRLALDAGLVKGRLQFALALLVASRSPYSEKRNGGAVSVSEKPLNEDAAQEVTRLALLRGCVMEGLFSGTNRATERVLARNGYRIVDASGQLCCGALHSHAGYLETARNLARSNIDAFADSGAQLIISNSAGCGAAMKEYAELLHDDPSYAAAAKVFSSQVRDISELLAERGIRAPGGRVTRRVAYDAACHLIHAQKIADAPIAVLKQIPGLELLTLRNYESCCGGAGIYNLQHSELSSEILSDKLNSIQASGAEIVATANPGCIMQIGAGLLLNGIEAEVVHPVQLLDEAYSTEEG
jgi:glycolate dehydrogenase iron-sulfur subunit